MWCRPPLPVDDCSTTRGRRYRETVATLGAMTSTVFQLCFAFIALGVFFAGGGVFLWGWRQIMG